MATQFHEDFDRGEGEARASERSFGLVMAGFFALVGLWPLIAGHNPRWWALPIAAAFAAFALFAPQLLKHPNSAWMALGRLLNRLVSFFELRTNARRRVSLAMNASNDRPTDCPIK